MTAAAPEWTRFPVLVVDDEQDNLDAFRFNFGKQFRLLYASSGEQALELARTNAIAVVVTDQRMPRMTGLELLRAVRGSVPPPSVSSSPPSRMSMSSSSPSTSAASIVT